MILFWVDLPLEQMTQVYAFARALLRKENKNMVVLTARTCDFIS